MEEITGLGKRKVRVFFLLIEQVSIRKKKNPKMTVSNVFMFHYYN